MAETVSADYLVVGTGAMGMAFVDTLVSDTKSTVIMVDRYARPGGHWTIAYPYVRLHQPSAFYGVNSRPLGQDAVDQVGWNKGLAELATGDEVCAYYSVVMHQTFLPSGRVRYFPKHDYTGKGHFRSILTGNRFQVGPETRIVDATYMKVKVPSMTPPRYEVDEDVTVITPNALAHLSRPHEAYTVVGAGKTGIDACLWLLGKGIDPTRITWIMPRDSWFVDRAALQPGELHAATKSMANKVESIMAATSTQDLFLRLEACVQLMRLDEKVWPTMFKCATISLAELEQIQRITNIIRKGRVARIETTKVTLSGGSYKPVPDTIYIDCTADALARLDPVPVFHGNNITLQSVRHCQQVFSAAFIAHIEATYPTEQAKNDLCQVVPHPDQAVDWLSVNLQTQRNVLRWRVEPKTAEWLSRARLDWSRTLLPSAPDDPEQQEQLSAVLAAQIETTCTKLEKLITQLPEGDAARPGASQLQEKP